ncbi:MAG: DUF1501 domain-containing protein [Planctomycetes bacterium]|nr:DUF1501 domain-containing protein [Planctomycetota bacterium]
MLTVCNSGPANLVSRRGFLRLGALGLGGLTLPQLLAAQDSQPRARRDTAVILYWMAGGPSQLDTWDPKPNAPVEVRGPFASIPTRTPGARICELLPEQAKVSDKFTLLRSVTHREFNHPDASHLVQTGYHEANVQFRGQIYPAQGSIVARLRGANRPGIPPYVCIPDAYFARQGFFQKATYLGGDFDPVNSGGEPTFRFTSPVPSFGLPGDLTVTRSENRRELLRRIDAARRDAGPAVERMGAVYQRAFELITSEATRTAFDLSREPRLLREKYGDNPWGRGALLARRLVEAGVTFVTMNHYEADVDWWDDHYTIEANLRRRLPPFDRALAALIEDIHTRGLAERVLLIAMGEFGRGTRIDALAGRGHWARAMSILLSGGGMSGGRVIGATTANAGEPATQAYSPGDLLATIYQFLGIDPGHMLPDRQNRPVRLVDHGTPIQELRG